MKDTKHNERMLNMEVQQLKDKIALQETRGAIIVIVVALAAIGAIIASTLLFV